MPNETYNPAITVVLATYNGERFLAEQLDSILAQTVPPSELVIVDDGSTDNTLTILKEYCVRHSHIRIYQNKENLGYIKTFEKGMGLAKGDLIALSDQDDSWRQDKLEILINSMGENEIVYSDSALTDADGKLLGKNMSDIKNMLSYNDCLMYTIGAWAPGHAMLFRKSLVARCMPFPSLVTHDFWLGYVASCRGTVVYVPETLVYYRQHGRNAIGANTHAAQKKRPGIKEQRNTSRARMQLLYNNCPAENSEQKRVLGTLVESYRSFSLRNNWLRMKTFFTYRHKMLAYKKKSAFMKLLFCVKMFFKID